MVKYGEVSCLCSYILSVSYSWVSVWDSKLEIRGMDASYDREDHEDHKDRGDQSRPVRLVGWLVNWVGS